MGQQQVEQRPLGTSNIQKGLELLSLHSGIRVCGVTVQNNAVNVCEPTPCKLRAALTSSVSASAVSSSRRFLLVGLWPVISGSAGTDTLFRADFFIDDSSSFSLRGV